MNGGKAPAQITTSQIRLFRSLFTGLNRIYGSYVPETGRCFQVKQPVTDEVIHNHLAGHRPYGVYLLDGDLTRAVVADFDHEETENPMAYCAHARHYGISAHLARSRRRGWHAWTFCESNGIHAAVARAAVHLILSEVTTDHVEVFPKQDRLSSPSDSGCFINAELFGRLVPLGRTVFVDPDQGLRPYPDQWAFLASIVRVTEQELRTILELNDTCLDADNTPAPRNHVMPSRTYGLPPCAQRMLAEGVSENQRVACFRLAVQLRKAGLPQDLAEAALLKWACKNKPLHGKGIITAEEIIDQTAYACRRPYRACGCEDPAVIPFCDASCALHRRSPC
jgi:hypothetical protein